MLEVLRKRHTQRNIILTNYQKHFDKLVKIMRSTRKPPCLLKNKKQSLPKTNLMTQNPLPFRSSRLKSIACKNNIISVGQENQQFDKQFSIHRIFDKSVNARKIYPRQHYFHLTKTNKFYSKKLESVMLIIRFPEINHLPKSSQYLIQISPYMLRSPILTPIQLQKDIIGFKFKTNQKYFINLYQIRGTKQHLVCSGDNSQDFEKYGMNIQKKVKRKRQNQENINDIQS